MLTLSLAFVLQLARITQLFSFTKTTTTKHACQTVTPTTTWILYLTTVSYPALMATMQITPLELVCKCAPLLPPSMGRMPPIPVSVTACSRPNSSTPHGDSASTPALPTTTRTTSLASALHSARMRRTLMTAPATASTTALQTMPKMTAKLALRPVLLPISMTPPP